MFDDKNLLMITQGDIGYSEYNIGHEDNNFAISIIRTTKLDQFYKTTLSASQRNLIKSNKWDTRCSIGGITMGVCGDAITKVTSVIDKVGLLTLPDYNAVTSNGSDHSYLNIGNVWWLGTGYGSDTYNAFRIRSGGDLQSFDVESTNLVRPAVVLNSGVIATKGTGTSGDPYLVE